MSKEKNEPTDENSPELPDQIPQLDPWGQGLFSEEDYERLTKEFGIGLIQDVDIPYSKFAKNRFLRRKIIYGHRDFNMIVNASNTKNHGQL